MTTNRVKTFDEAFQSRIHVSLRYHDLKPDARQTIWVAFLNKVKAQQTIDPDTGLGITRSELHDLAERPVNGRQIKNVVKTASSLATACGERLGYAHLTQVLEMMAQFEVDRNDMPR